MAWTDVVSVAIGESTKASTMNGVIDSLEFRRNATNGDFTSIYVDTASDGTAAAPFLRRNATADGLFFASGVIGNAIGGAEIHRTNSTGILFPTGKILGVNTSDGSDNGIIYFSGGGASGDTRAAYIAAKGNENASGGGSLYLYAGNISTGNIIATTASAEIFRATYSGKFLLKTTTENGILTILKDNEITTSTADAADNGYLKIAGGGSGANTRGSWITLYGNEAGGTGRIDLNAGNVTGGDVRVYTGASLLRAQFLDAGEIKTYYIHNNGGTGNASNGCIASGSGSVVASTTTNLDAAPTVYYNWMRVGNCVTLAFHAAANVTAAATFSRFVFDIPVPSEFTSTYDAIGSGSAEAASVIAPVHLEAGTSGNDIVVEWYSNGTIGENVDGSLIYVVL